MSETVHELVRILTLIFLFPLLNRLRDFASGENKFRSLAIHAHPSPEQAGIADLQLQPGRLADDAHALKMAKVKQSVTGFGRLMASLSN